MDPAMNDPVRPPSASANTIWEDAGRMLAANAGLVAAIAGVFLFLPGLIEARFFPSPPPPLTFGASDVAEWQFQMNRYLEANWWWVLISTTSYLVGTLALYLLLLTPRITVGAALGRALVILPFYMLLALMAGFVVGCGLLLLIVPGIYLFGRLILSTPILAIEVPAAPLTAMRQSWRRTTRPWWTAGVLMLIVFTALLVALAINFGLGTAILLLAGPQGIGGLLLAAVQALTGTLVTVLVIVVTAALYRATPPV
jgi:hypothetical protein